MGLLQAKGFFLHLKDLERDHSHHDPLLLLCSIPDGHFRIPGLVEELAVRADVQKETKVRTSGHNGRLL
jgi:hypothetical protein